MMRRLNLPTSWTDLMLRRSGWRDDVSAYMDDELSPEERERVEARLAESGEMQEYLADLQQMHASLRRLYVEPPPVSFQLTPEMLDQPLRETVGGHFSPSRTMALASVAVIAAAAFAAALVFDLIDAPSVQYAQTSASSVAAEPASIPTMSVRTQPVEAQASPSAQSAGAAEPESSVAAFAEQAQEQAQAQVQAQAEQQAQEQAEAQAMAETDRGDDAIAQHAADEPLVAASDGPASSADNTDEPSRRALTAGRSDGEATDARPVSASAVLAASPQAEQSAMSEDAQAADDRSASANATTAADAADDESSSERSDASAEGSSAADPGRAQIAITDDGDAVDVEVTRTVRLVTVTEASDVESAWPLQERPRQPLAADPGWELPLQLALGSLAAAAAMACLLLGLWDRRTV